MTPLGADQGLALTYVAAGRRAGVEALWRLDAAMGAVLAGGRDPMIGRIKLAWWREALEKLDREAAPSEPVLKALEAHVLPRGLAGAGLAEMETGWAALLDPEPLTVERMDSYASARGGLLFAHSATLLGGEATKLVREAGESWALVELARRAGDAGEIEAALDAARRRAAPARWPARLRPLGMLRALAARDAEPGRPRWEAQGSPGRMLRMMRHRLSGL
jgi:phytoene synthase